MAPGTYKLKFSLLGGLEQFYPGRTDFASGASITVADGQTTGGVTDTVIAHGSLAGHVTTAAGAPAAHALAGTARPASGDLAHVLTDDGGGYTAHVSPSERIRVTAQYTLHSCPGSATSRDTLVTARRR